MKNTPTTIGKTGGPPNPSTNTPNYFMTHQTKIKPNTYQKLSAWIKSITVHNSLAYFESKIYPEIDPTCRLCQHGNETLHHLMEDCEATNTLQMDIMKNKILLPDI